MTPADQPEPTLQPASPPAAPNYTQVNILFPTTQVELPSADKFNSFPPEAQKAILTAFRIEQAQRHNWLHDQQKNDFSLNSRSQSFDFWLRLAGVVSATVLATVVLLIGAYLILHGAPVFGVVMLVGAAATLVGTAVYGHKAVQPKSTPEPKAPSK